MRNRPLPLLLLVALCAPAAAQQRPVATIRLRPGLVITGSARVVPGTYRLAAPASLDSAVIVVRGEGITVDFAGATMEGMSPEADPDRAAGVGIRIEGGTGVRLLHARVRGYHIGILARGTRALMLQDVDASHTWKPRLFSLVEHESLVDWQSFHHNEHREWMRFGAGLYLEDVRGGEITGSRAEQGHNGLLLVRSDSLRIADNDFSFNSGLGIGLYRSSDNTITGNRVDYDVRGYSHGFYRRGQDSAGILLYEQSCRNVIAWNSVTHGGDGLFLWAGQSTMDSGTGGANDNLVYANDFSFAPANGIEATFSRNVILANRVEGSDYGVWGGYSFGSVVVGNRFAGNRIGVAIEHGQDNRIAANRFDGDGTAVSLWADSITATDWGYPRFRDTRSRDTRVENNLFLGNRVAVRARSTSGLVVRNNSWAQVDSVMVLRDTAGFRIEGNRLVEVAAPTDTGMPPLPVELIPLARPLAGRGQDAVPTSPPARRDRSAIVVDEWGPFDWRSPKLWPVDSVRSVALRLAVLGPPGSWRVVDRRHVTAPARAEGRVGDTIGVTPLAGWEGDWDITLEYRGGEVVSPRGRRSAAGVPYRFSLGRWEPAVDWTVRFFAWDDSTDPRTHAEAFQALLRGAPVLERRVPRLDWMWYRPVIRELSQERWALEATGTVTLASGAYTLRTISDDGVRVWVDGVLAIDDWTPHESAVDHASLTGGGHELRVQYYQVGGWVELRLEIVRGEERSAGTPGSR